MSGIPTFSRSHESHMTRKHVIGWGALNVDLIYKVPTEVWAQVRDRTGLQPGGELFLGSQDFEAIADLLDRAGMLQHQSGGGSAANTIVALARMGFDVGYVGKVGTDAYGDVLLESLEGVDTRGIRRGDRSGVCMILLDETGERSNMVFPNSNDMLTVREVDREYIQATSFLHLTSFVGDAPLEAQGQIVEELPSHVKISFDPGELYARRPLTEILPILRRTCVLFATDREIQFMTSRAYREGAEALLQQGVGAVVCKRGACGSYVLSEAEAFEVPAQRIRVVDKTGAGDVYAAGFLAGLLLNRPLRICAQLATHAAARSISGYGREHYPDRVFLNRLLTANSANECEYGS